MTKAINIKEAWPIVAAGAAVLLCIHRKKGKVSGIGAMLPIGTGVGDSINPTIINKARELFENFDEACEIEREHSEKVDVVFEELEGRGIDWQSEDGQKIANEALFRAGLSDPDGNTDVYVNRINARKELLNFLQQVIVPLLPICDNDKELLMNISSITKQNDFIDLMRGYLM